MRCLHCDAELPKRCDGCGEEIHHMDWIYCVQNAGHFCDRGCVYQTIVCGEDDKGDKDEKES